jgi:predicted DNA-binding protein
MAVYIKRVQTVLTEEQYENLSRLAVEVEKPLSVLIREAIEVVYFKPVDLDRRRAALDSLLSLDAPVAAWEQMEEEIVRGALE